MLIHQMGKVASSTIFETLRASGLRRPLFHVHFLNPDSMKDAEERLYRAFGGRGSVNRWALYESRFVIRHFLANRDGPLKLISLVREPVSRNVSSFFSNLDIYLPDCARRFAAGTLNIEDIARCFLEEFHEHDYTLNWFDREVKSVFGIDVFADDDLVERTKGLLRFTKGATELLVLRVEDIKDVAPRALAGFLGLSHVELRIANEASSKDYQEVYREFKQRLALPHSYLDKMYDSKLARRFYDPREIAVWRSHWSRS